MKTKLIKILKDRKSGIEKRTIITVLYCPITYVIDIVSIEIEIQNYSFYEGCLTYLHPVTCADLTELFLNNFPILETEIKDMNWEEVYEETKYKEVA
jgi:hypothetical protein